MAFMTYLPSGLPMTENVLYMILKVCLAGERLSVIQNPPVVHWPQLGLPRAFQTHPVDWASSSTIT